MQALDWVLLAVLLASMILGTWRGLVYEALSVLAWVLAFVLAQWYALAAAAWLPMSQVEEPLRYAAGFVLVFVAVVFAGGLLAWIVRRLIESVGLRPIDRVLGAVFGLARGLLLLLAAALVVELTPLKSQPVWHESAGANALVEALRQIRPLLPATVEKYMP